MDPFWSPSEGGRARRTSTSERHEMFSVGNTATIKQTKYLEELRVLTGNYLGLIRVQRDAIHRPLRVERARVRRAPKVPELHGSVLAPAVQVPPVALESKARDVPGMALQAQYRILVRRIVNLEQSYVRVPPRREVLLVGRYFETIHLAVGVPEDAGADPARRLPEADFVVLARGGEYHAH